MRLLDILTTTFLFILFMGYECLGCHQVFDQKGSHSRHTAKCNKFKEEARKRRTNYGLTISAPRADDPPIAGGSHHPGMLEEVVEVVEEHTLGAVAITTLEDAMVRV